MTVYAFRGTWFRGYFTRNRCRLNLELLTTTATCDKAQKRPGPLRVLGPLAWPSTKWTLHLKLAVVATTHPMKQNAKRG